MSKLLVEEIEGVPVYFNITTPVAKFYRGKSVVFKSKDHYYYVKENPGNIKLSSEKMVNSLDLINEVEDLTEFFSVPEKLFTEIVFKGCKLMVLLKGPDLPYIKADLIHEGNYDDPIRFIGYMKANERDKDYIFRTTQAILVKNAD